MSKPTMNSYPHSCSRQRADQFLNSNDYRIEDADLIAHLDSCEPCRQYMEHQAAPSDVWIDLRTMLKASEFDSAGSVDFSAATIGIAGQKPVAARDVIDSLAPSDDPHRLGRLGSYEVTGVVGVGGMGVVLKAIDPSLDRVVAIKVMAPHLANNENARKRFTREAKAAAAVLHPNVIPIHSVTSGASLPYLVMSYIRGGSLQKRLEQEGKLATVEVLRIGAQIAAGLAAAHDQGLVHRDIKPENILLEDGVERVTITDFGLARAVDDNTVTQQGTIAGTPMYMSPEQARGEQVNQQSDLFSLGSVLYALCTGRPPYRAESSFGVMRKIIDESPTQIRQINPDVPVWLTAIIGKLMSKDKAARFQTAAEVHALLEACLSHVQQPDAIPLPEFSGSSGNQQPQSFLKAAKGKMVLSSLATAIVLLVLATLQLGGFLTQPPNNGQTNLSSAIEQNANEIDAGLKIEEYEKANPGKHHWKLRGYNVGEMKVQLLLIVNGESKVLREHIVRGSDKPNVEVEIDFEIGKLDKLVMQRAPLPELPMLAVHGEKLLTSERKFTLEDIAIDISNMPKMYAAMAKDKAIPAKSPVPLYYGSYSNSDSTYKNDVDSMVKASLKGESFIVVALTWNPKKPATQDDQESATKQPSEKTQTVNNSGEHINAAIIGKAISPRNAHRIQEQSAVTFREAITGMQRGPHSGEITLKTFRGIRVVDDSTIKVLSTVGPKEQIDDGALSLDGKRLAWTKSVTSKVYEVELEPGKTLKIELGGDNTGPTNFSPDNQLLAIVSSMIDPNTEGEGTSTTALFDLSGKMPGKVLYSLGSNFRGLQLPVFSPDSKTLVLTNSDDVLQVVDVATGKVKFILDKKSPKEIAFKPDGKLIAVAYADGTVSIWESATGSLVRSCNSGCRELYSIDWSPMGDILATAGRGGKCALWEPDQLEKVKELEMEPFDIRSIRFTSDGCRVVMASSFNRTDLTGQSVFVWSIPDDGAASPSAPRQVPSNVDAPKVNKPIYSTLIQSAQDAINRGKRDEAVSALELTELELRGWEFHYLLAQATRSGEDREKLKRNYDGNGFHIESIAFTPDGQRLVMGSAQKLVKVWDLNKDEAIELEDSKPVSGAVAASPDGKMVATEGPDGDIFVWDIMTGKKQLQYKGHRLPADAPYGQTALIVKSICFSPDSTQIVSAAYTATSGVHQKGEVKVWSVETGQTLVTLQGPHAKGPLYITTATFSPDGKRIATGGFDKKIKLWDAVTGREILAIEGHTNNVLCVAYSPDGQRLASASADGTLAVWDVATGHELVRMSGHTKPVFSVQFTDAKRIVSGSWDETIKLWEVNTGAEVMTLGKLHGPVLTVAVSRDGQKIAAAGSLRNTELIAEATVWDISKESK